MVAPYSTNGVFAGESPISSSVSLLILQLLLIISLSRFIGFLLSPLRQPRVIAEIIAGILLGPSALGRIKGFTNHIFTPESVGVLGTLSNFALIFFLFLIGLELNPQSLRHASRSAVSISVAGIVLPFGLGAAVSLVIKDDLGNHGVGLGSFTIFMGVAMSITAFPVLARILTERKLLSTSVGQMAMSAAAIDDVIAWCLLALTIALLSASKSPIICLWTFLCGSGFVVLMLVVVRKGIARVSQFEQFRLTETTVILVFCMVMTGGFFTDLIGIHAIFGGFIVGCVMPKDSHFVHAMTEKLEDIIVNLFLPAYFAISGIKTQIGFLNSGKNFGILALVIVVACVGKLIGCGLMARVAGLPPRKALTLAVLMNTKGLVELIVLNIGLSKGVINQQTFTLMVLMALFTTFITSPVVSLIYSPEDDIVDYRMRAGKRRRTDGFRLMTCLTGMRSVPPMVMLIETVKGQPPETAQVHCVHLIELSERPSAFMSIQTQKKEKVLADPLSLALESYGRVNRVRITPLLTISSPNDMHEDIRELVCREDSTLLVLPYHEHSPSDRLLDFSRINVVAGNVLQTSQCSVGLMVDLGLRRAAGTVQPEEDHDDYSAGSAYRVVVLFFGGPDDREALALGARMCTHPNVQLTVIRFSFTDMPAADLAVAVTDSCERLPLEQSAVREQDDIKDQTLLQCITCETSPFKSRIEVVNRGVADPLVAALHVANTFEHHVLLVGRTMPNPTVAVQQFLQRGEPNVHHLGAVGSVVVGHERTPASLLSSPIVLVMQQALNNPCTIEAQVLKACTAPNTG
eukprot:TRINITY_DN9332_c0_g1_i1.p1 TRINITY_DN9332_c0_g1~~TRINITY_DN9332_c0_g1_i1.p1  ORF type:complete len:802 (+),score=111.49 TRINITY_DN9332_c0_g1_i1:43-2448(+)